MSLFVDSELFDTESKEFEFILFVSSLEVLLFIFVKSFVLVILEVAKT